MSEDMAYGIKMALAYARLLRLHVVEAELQLHQGAKCLQVCVLCA